MSTEFKSTRVNATGSVTPILLVGGRGEGKETKFIPLLSYGIGSEKPLVLRPSLFADNLFDPAGDPSAKELLSKIEVEAKGHSSVIAVFEGIDECLPIVAVELLKGINEKQDGKLICVFSCTKIPDFIENSPAVKSQLQIVQFELPPKQPVLQVHELEESPFHEYGDKAAFLAKYPQRINDPKDAEMLNSLADLMQAIEGIEGGILGQEASDRGMDGSVIQSLAAFSRVFKGSENELADGIARSVIKELLACPVVPKFIEVNPQQHRHEPESPSLG
jgi:hypothetical protein